MVAINVPDYRSAAEYLLNGSNDVTLTAGNYTSTVLVTGDGNDKVNATIGSFSSFLLSTGGGGDESHVTAGEYSSVSANGGEGSDYVGVRAGTGSNVAISGGGHGDTLEALGSGFRAEFTGGTGNDLMIGHTGLDKYHFDFSTVPPGTNTGPLTSADGHDAIQHFESGDLLVFHTGRVPVTNVAQFDALFDVTHETATSTTISTPDRAFSVTVDVNLTIEQVFGSSEFVYYDWGL